MTEITVPAQNERERLIGYMKRYLDALVARDFRPIKFSPNFRHTENTCEIPLGSGIGRTIRSLWADGHYFVDVKTGQVEYWGVCEENTRQTMIGVRLKVEGLLISESEAMTARGKGEYFNTEVVSKGTPGFHDILPETERVSREELVEAANLYFDGIERSDGSIVPVIDNALRLVNGAEDAGTEDTELGEDMAYRRMSVKDQISKRYYSYIEQLRGRRFVVVDEERGLVLVHVLFDHPADHDTASGVLPWPEPNTVLALEVFKVRNGLIETVWAIGTGFPYGARSGWGDGETRSIRGFA